MSITVKNPEFSCRGTLMATTLSLHSDRIAPQFPLRSSPRTTSFFTKQRPQLLDYRLRTRFLPCIASLSYFHPSSRRFLCVSASISKVSSSIILRHNPTAYKPQTSATVFPSIKVNHQVGRRKTSGRGISVVTRAGANASSYIFAFVLPLSLLVVTVFTSVRIADKLDQKFLEEVAINEAILEVDEDEEGDKITISSNKESVAPVRTRNRPKREVEV